MLFALPQRNKNSLHLDSTNSDKGSFMFQDCARDFHAFWFLGVKEAPSSKSGPGSLSYWVGFLHFLLRQPWTAFSPHSARSWAPACSPRTSGMLSLQLDGKLSVSLGIIFYFTSLPHSLTQYCAQRALTERRLTTLGWISSYFQLLQS